MAVKTFNTRIKLKYDSNANWRPTSGDGLVLLAGEFAFDSDKKNFFIGDGITGTKNLKYVIGEAIMADYTNLAQGVSPTAITSSMSLNDALANLQGQINNVVSGGVTDVKVDGNSVVSSNEASLSTINGDYNASTNRIATSSDITNAINALDGSITGTPGAGKTPVSFSQTDGVITASFADISITSSQISDLASNAVTGLTGDTWINTNASTGSVTLTHAEATNTASENTATIGTGNTGASTTFNTVTYSFDNAGHVNGHTTTTNTIIFPSAADLGLSSAMHFIGTSSTDPTSAGGPTVDGHTGTWTSGDVVLYNTKEYVYDGTRWVELGDEGSYAQKTVTITGTGALSGGGTLEANRTITHNTSGVTAGTYATNATTTLTNGGTFNIPQVTVDTYGHITAASDVTLTLPTITVNTHTLSIGTAGAYNTYNPSVQGSTDQIVTIAGSGPISAESSTGSATTITISHDGPGANGADITEVTTPSALKVAYDAKGHITSSAALTATDVTRTATASIAATTVEGALQELATAITEGTNGNLITTNTAAQQPGSELMSNDINLHKIAKTANPADLIQPTGDMIIFDCGSASVNTGTETGAIEPNASTPNA